MPFLAENDAKWAPQGDPQILKNPQKSSKVLPKVPPGMLLYADPEKIWKSSEMCAFQGGPICNPYTPVQSKHTFSFSYFCSKMHRKDLQNATFWAPLGTQMLPNVAF